MMRIVTAVVVSLVVAGLGRPMAGALAADTSSPPPQATELTQARSLIANKDFAAAVPLLKAAVAKSPNSADAWNLMGYTHRKLGQTAEAEGYYQKALALDSAHLGAMEYLGELYVETGRLDDAKKMLKRLDDACFFGCQEYDALKRAVYGTKTGDSGSPPNKW